MTALLSLTDVAAAVAGEGWAEVPAAVAVVGMGFATSSSPFSSTNSCGQKSCAPVCLTGTRLVWCVCIYIYIYIYMGMHVVCVCLVCVCVCMYVCMYACMHVCMYAVCLCVCIYVCMHVCIFTYT